MATAISPINLAIVSGDFAEYKVFQEHLDSTLMDMLVLMIVLEHLVPKNKNALKIRRIYLNVKGANVNRKPID